MQLSLLLICLPLLHNNMFISKQKIKIVPQKLSQNSDDYNEFLDDFLKPPQKIQDSSRRFRGKQEATIKLQHNSVPSKIPRNQLQRFETQANRQIKEILRNIKKEEQLRKEKMRTILHRLAQEKEEEKKLYEFRVAERRIKKRLMLLERKEKLQQELLSFVHQRQDDPTPSKQRKEKAKSVDDVIDQPLSDGKTNVVTRQVLKESNNKDILLNQSHTSVIKQRVHISSEILLPKIHNGSDVTLNRRNRVSTITLTKELRIEEEGSKPKHKDYLKELRQGKTRNYTESNSELQRILNQRDLSKQRSRTEKAERAVELTNNLQNKRRLRLKNPNDVDFKQAERKIQLLNFLQRAQQE